MKKIVLYILSVITTVTVYAVEPFNGTFAEAVEKAKKENKEIFIEFTASWSEPCKEFRDRILTKRDVIKVFEKNYIYISVDATEQKYANMVKMYGTGRGVPIYTIINYKGEVVNKIDGAILKKDPFLATLYHRSGRKNKMASSQHIEEFNQLIAESITFDNKKPGFETDTKTNVNFVDLLHRMHFVKWKPGVSVGLKFSQMSELLTNTTTGYNVDLFMYRHINKFTFQPGINFNSSGGENSEMKLISHNLQLPLSVGIDLFRASIVTSAQPIKLFVAPYAQYAMKTKLPDQFKRWDIGTKASINAELGTFELSVFYEMGFIDQSKLPGHDIFNRSYGVNFSMIWGR